MSSSGMAVFAIGVGCGVVAVVGGALTVAPQASSPPPASVVAPGVDGGPSWTLSDVAPAAPAPGTTTVEAGETAGQAMDVDAVLAETGDPNPYSWYRWHLIRPGDTRIRVRDLIGAPSAEEGNGKAYFFQKQADVPSSPGHERHKVEFYDNKVREWICDYIDNSHSHRPELFSDAARWSLITPGSSLRDVVGQLGEPTRYRSQAIKGQLRLVKLEYRVPQGGSGFVILDVQDRVAHVERPGGS